MARRARLDAELVRRGLVGSREQAARAIAEGRVRIAGQLATKPATAVDPATPVLVSEPAGEHYASRGGDKLAGALLRFTNATRPLAVAGRRCLDAGASTGGFTDVLLRAGARSVVAVDVGYGQLAWPLRTDARVDVRDRTNVRHVTLADLGEPVDVVVADLSFISLMTVLPALIGVAHPGADFVLLVKPQFEVGRARLGAGGVVREPELRASAVVDVAEGASALGLGVVDVVASGLPGPAGNVEYFLWLRRGAAPLDRAAVERAVEEGPA